MDFRKARQDELQTVFELYRSVVGDEFCVWNDDYPGMLEVEQDSEAGNLFVATENGRIIGAASIVPENEMDDLSAWRISDGSHNEIARIVVDKGFRGRGIAADMVSGLIDELKGRGCSSIHLSVVRGNIPALKTYQKLGFEHVGEADMYGGHYDLLEMII